MPLPVQELGRVIKQLQSRHHRLIDADLRRIGSSLAQWDALRAIQQNPRASARLLAAQTFQTDQSFGTLATRLEKKGLIERRSGAGRAIAHSLTPAGQRLLEESSAVVDHVLTASLGGLQASEQEQLYALIARVLAAHAPD